MADDFTRYGREWYAQLQDENRTLRSDLESAEAEATALRMMGVHLSPDDESLHVECRKREAALQERVGRAVALIGGDHWSMADWRLALAILRGEEGTDGNE